MLTDDGSRTLFDRRLNETYHSGCGALTECVSVYLRNSGVEQLLTGSSPLDVSPFNSFGQPREPVRVLELGFGTGMAALLTMVAAKSEHRALDYISLEQTLLPRDVLEQLEIGNAVNLAIARGQLPAPFAVSTQLEQDWLRFRSQLPSSPSDGEYIWDAGDNVRLRLVLGDAMQYVNNNRDNLAGQFEAIYFDAFSPATNPQLWTSEVFAAFRSVLKPNCKLVSYCVSGHVRRGLEHAGFAVQRVPGPPGGKREVLIARAPAAK